MSRFHSIVRSWSAISRSLPQFAPARRPHARRRPMLECLEDRALLSTIPITVSSLADSGGGTLRSAIAAADMGSTNNYVINIKTPGTITLKSALPDLSNNITIHGLGAGTSTVQRDTSLSTSFRIFTVDAGETVKISGLTIAGGNAGSGLGISQSGGGIDNSGTLTVRDSVFTNNSALFGYGGGLANEDGGTLTVRGCTFTSNSAGSFGGGIDSEGMATVRDSTFTSNSSGFGNGCLANIDGTLTVSGSTFTSNSGGGLGNDSGTATVSDSTFTSNSAIDGGGIFNVGGTLTVRGSTFTSNSATNGGGIYSSNSLGRFATLTVIGSTFTSNSATNGGGIFNNARTLTVIGSTFTSNSASFDGGGLDNEGMATVIGSTFTSNSAIDGGGIYNDDSGTLAVTDSIFAYNSATDGGGIYNAGTFLIDTNNLFFDITGGDIYS